MCHRVWGGVPASRVPWPLSALPATLKELGPDEVPGPGALVEPDVSPGCGPWVSSPAQQSPGTRTQDPASAMPRGTLPERPTLPHVAPLQIKGGGGRSLRILCLNFSSVTLWRKGEKGCCATTQDDALLLRQPRGRLGPCRLVAAGRALLPRSSKPRRYWGRRGVTGLRQAPTRMVAPPPKTGRRTHPRYPLSSCTFGSLNARDTRTSDESWDTYPATRIFGISPANASAISRLPTLADHGRGYFLHRHQHRDEEVALVPERQEDRELVITWVDTDNKAQASSLGPASRRLHCPVSCRRGSRHRGFLCTLMKAPVS